MTGIALDSVTKVYPGGNLAVDRLSVRIPDGEFFVLLGPSGCGKSTVLRMIAGLEEITSGDLWLGDDLANSLTPRERNVAMVFQSSALYPHLSVRDNISFPLRIAREDPVATRERVHELSRALGIDPTLDRMPGTLSGGQKQRVAIGRAIIREPSLFLMDEPLSNLDAALRTELRLEISSLARSLGVTTVYVTHDQIEALTLADRIAIMRDGVLEDIGTPNQVYNDPATAFTASFLGSPQINLLAVTAWAIRDRGVVLDCGGGQTITVPWTDPRANALAGRHGEPIIMGVRSDGFTPVPEPDPQLPVLSGRLRALEFHGHEWQAHVECGVTVTSADQVGRPDRPRPETAPYRPSLQDRALALLTRRTLTASEPTGHEAHVGHHRRSDLQVRVESRSDWRDGQVVYLAMDLARALFFGADGRRVDPVRR